jgi:uncharacterized lipoprotein YbaY
MRRLLSLCAVLPAVALALHPHPARGVDPRKTTSNGAAAAGNTSVLPVNTPPATATPSSITPATAPRPAATTSAATAPTTTLQVPTTRDRTAATGPTGTIDGSRPTAAIATPGIAPQPNPVPGPTTPQRPPKWRIGVYSQDTDAGVKILRVVAGSPAERAGLEPDDVIVNVAGYQVGNVNGQHFDCGYEFESRCDTNGNVSLLVRDHRNGNLVNLPIQLESRLQKVSGSIAFRNRINLPQNAVVTAELREIRSNSAEYPIGRQTIDDIRQVPIPFTIEYDPLDVDTRRTYVISATIASNNRVLYATAQSFPVNIGAPNQTVAVAVDPAAQNTQTAAADRQQEIEQQIVQWFQDYYGRPPKPHELPVWTAQVTERGRSLDDVQAELLTSEGLFNQCDRDKVRYIEMLSQQLIGRKPTQEELDYWLAKYDLSGGQRLDVARAFLAGVPH